MLGSAGFYGGEISYFKPIDITAGYAAAAKESPSVINSEPYRQLKGEDLGHLLERDSGEETHPQTSVQTPTESEKYSSRHAYVDKKISYADIVKKSPEKQPSAQEKHSHQEKHSLQNKAPSSMQRTAPASDADQESSVDTESMKTQRASVSLRTRTHRPSSGNSIQQPDRTQTQHQRDDHTAQAKAKAGGEQQDLGARIYGLTQDSQLLKNMDSLSGGLFGTAIFMAAAVASTAEAAAGTIKHNLPDSVKDFAQELRDTLDYSIIRLEDSSISAIPNEETWGIRKAVSQILEEDNMVASSYKSTPPSSPHKLSVEDSSTLEDHDTPATCADVARVTCTTAESGQNNEEYEASEHQQKHGRGRDRHTHHLVIHPHDEFDIPHTGHVPVILTMEGIQPPTMQEYTLDEHGHKVTVVDERRDSGFDMLS
ncbi:hypothetical protein BC939DRAFT_6922 [Gamsiella multidivaricata]|uniref:uncharacterized protein n=1 Tax=Gamsiella multidivaricata TaxID=101098 RepID=UPI002220C3B7|nr:uncharacterized protein BC939DRAFT_6922 [Gamsiella multidivaricata]KAI7832820.1 hypothetical protein BC939DRAFT_6922 [Gamsiella multidivaricata]